MNQSRRQRTALLVAMILWSGGGLLADTAVTQLNCTLDCALNLQLTWENNDAYSSIEILENGAVIVTLPGDSTSYSEPSAQAGSVYGVQPYCGAIASPLSECQATIPPINGLSCTRDCANSTIAMQWSNPVSYDEIHILANGVTVQSLDGGATSAVVDLSGATLFEVQPNCVAIPPPGAPAQPPRVGCSVGTLPIPVSDHLILDFDLGGSVDSSGQLEMALGDLGEPYSVITSLDEIPCGYVPGEGTIIWSLTGTFPDHTVMSAAHADLLVSHILMGGGVYHEGNDTWATDPPTVFFDYDGIGAVTDGNNSLSNLVGFDLLEGYQRQYQQDQAGNESTDQLSTTDTDLGGPDSRIAWQNVGQGVNYTAATFYVTDADLGNVFCQSFEIGGLTGGSLVPIVDDIIKGICPPPCIRVTNLLASQGSDGVITVTWTATGTLDWTSCDLIVTAPNGSTQIFSVTNFLGPVLYAPLTAGDYTFTIVPTCGTDEGNPMGVEITVKVPFMRGDTNLDGVINVADVIRMLTVLFGGPGFIGEQDGFECAGAADANGDQLNDVADAVYLLLHLFSNGDPPPPPHFECLIDDDDTALPCDNYDACP